MPTTKPLNSYQLQRAQMSIIEKLEKDGDILIY